MLIGTKAQFIKMAPVLVEMDRRGASYTLVYTGQHFETFDLLEQAFGTRAPDEILVPEFEAATHRGFARWTFLFWRETARRILAGRWRGHSWALVHGDTASTLFGAVAARLAGVKVAHIEAGLRSPRLMEPFPEEIVRRLVSKLSRLHFAPDDVSCDNLERVGGEVVNTRGNTLRDSLRLALSSAREAETVGAYGVFSMHRSENLSQKATFGMLMEMVVAVSRIVPLKFVLHPATRAKIRSSGWLEKLEAERAVTLMDRMDYPEFIALLRGGRFLMTDGGSNQEEAAMLGMPTLLLRRATERNDGLDDTVFLSGLRPNRILDFARTYAEAAWQPRTVGEESPSRVIVDRLLNE